MRYAFTIVLAGWCLFPGAPASAQDTEFADLHDRLMQLQDTSELHRLESSSEDLTAGFAALRLWELTHERRHAVRSRRYFDRASERDPNNAWAHYGHALSFRPDIEKGPGRIAADDALGRAFGMDALSRARRALERAVALDPSLPGAAELLARYANETRDGEALERAQSALQVTASSADAPPDVRLALARTEREQGNYEAAARAAERAATGPEDVAWAEAQLELAAALASIPGRRAEAGRAYLTALEAADDALLARLWEDAKLVARPAEMKRWDTARTVDARRHLLRSFWEIRGALAACDAGARAAEHYARLNHAWREHRRWGRLGAPPLAALRFDRTNQRFSDAGLIYIRHGPPDHIMADQRAEYMIWYYHDDDGEPLSFHFATHGWESGYSKDPVLLGRLPCLEPEAALRDPRLRPLTFGCDVMDVLQVSSTIRRDAERALRTDSDRPRFARELPFAYELYSFRADSGQTELVAAVSVPLGDVAADAQRLQLTFAVIDTAGYAARQAAGSALIGAGEGGQRVLRAHLGLVSPPVLNAAWRLDVRSADGRSGSMLGGAVDVPRYAIGRPELSDLVLAHPDADGSFARGDVRLALVPNHHFPNGRFRLYYEAYDLPAGAPFRTEIRVERTSRGLLGRLFGKRDGIVLSFDERVPDDAGTTLRTLRDVAAPLVPGDWVIRVRMTSPAWPSAIERERRFTVPAAADGS